MVYYRFENSADAKIIGDFPQCELSRNVNPRNPDSPWNVQRDEFPDFLPNIELAFFRRAKVTDILSALQVGHGYVINSKVRSILESQNLPPHTYYPVKFESKAIKEEYYWFHFISKNFWDWIDKEESKMSLRSIYHDKHDEILAEVNLFWKLENFESLALNRPSLTNYYWDRIVFNASFPEYDILSTPFPSLNTIISSDLLEELKKANITGYEVFDFCEVISEREN